MCEVILCEIHSQRLGGVTIHIQQKMEYGAILDHIPQDSVDRLSTKQLTVDEITRVKNVIKNVFPTICKGFKITHNLIFIMID